MNRDELARHLYIHNHDTHGATQWERDQWATEWDASLVTDEDVEFCYARADRMIRDGEVPA